MTIYQLECFIDVYKRQVQNIESIFYPGARHELLVETNKLEVFGDIATWLDKQLTKQ